MEVEIPPEKSALESINRFAQRVAQCHKACITAGGKQVVIAMMRGVKDVETRRDYFDPSSSIGDRNDSWDLYAALPQGRKSVDKDPIDVEAFDERVKMEVENISCQGLKVSALKKEMDELGVGYKGFCEKSEFISALADARVYGCGEREYADNPNEIFLWGVHQDGNHVTLWVLRFNEVSDEAPEITSNSSRMAAEVADMMKKAGASPQTEKPFVTKPSKLALKPFYYDDARMFRDIIGYGSDNKLEWQEVPGAGGGEQLMKRLMENKMSPELSKSEYHPNLER